jgi:hypothetical protein
VLVTRSDEPTTVPPLLGCACNCEALNKDHGSILQIRVSSGMAGRAVWLAGWEMCSRNRTFMVAPIQEINWGGCLAVHPHVVALSRASDRHVSMFGGAEPRVDE